jgi:hypothetical protein
MHTKEGVVFLWNEVIKKVDTLDYAVGKQTKKPSFDALIFFFVIHQPST